MRNTKVVFYARISTKSNDQLNSFDNQEAFLTKYLENNSEYKLYESESNSYKGIYADKGISGTLFSRDAFEKMLYDAGLDCKFEKYKVTYPSDVDGKEYEVKYRDYQIRHSNRMPKFKYIIAKSTSRFARNIMVVDILRKLHEIGVYVKFLDINKSTENADDITIIQLFQYFDEMFSRDLSRKLLIANKQSADNEKLRSNDQLLGYDYHSDYKNRTYKNTINEKERPIVEQIFRLYHGCFAVDNLEKPQEYTSCDFKCLSCEINKNLPFNAGIGFRNILKVINKGRNFIANNGQPLSMTRVKSVIENEKYAGFLNNRKWNHGTVFNYLPYGRKNGKYETKYRPDLTPPIISQELFDACNAKRFSKAKGSIGVYKGAPTEYKGLLYCVQCGGVMRHGKATDGKGLYICKTKKDNGLEACDAGNVYDYQIEEYIGILMNGGINDIINSSNKSVVATLIHRIKCNIDSVAKGIKPNEIQEAKERFQESENALKRAYNEKFKSKTPEVLDSVIEDLENELMVNKNTFDNLSKEPKTYLSEAEEYIINCFEIIEIMNNLKPTYSKDEIMGLVEHFNVFSEASKIGKKNLAPRVQIYPNLRFEAKAEKQLGLSVEGSIFTPPIFYNLGVVQDKPEIELIEDELKKLQEQLASYLIIYK